MRILLYRADGDTQPWIDDFSALLPQADITVWSEDGGAPPCDYAVVWQPPVAMLAALREVKAIFLAGAGVDAVLKLRDADGQGLPASVPLVRLGDAGMGLQMAEYVLHFVLRHFRRFDEYEEQARHGLWSPLPPYRRDDFGIGVLGAGMLGRRVLDALAPFGFPLRAWSRSEKALAGVSCFAGADGLDAFLRGSRVLVNMLPLTPATSNILDRTNLAKLPPSAYLINVARGAHVAEPDLLALIRSGHLAGAALDVFRNEPLPAQHPFWLEPRITITPHISALTLRRESIGQIADKMGRLEAGLAIADIVDRSLGY